MNILIVDDSKAVHAFMKSIFKDTSHRLNHAENGAIAIEKLQNQPEIDLVLLDWEMPVMSGVETLEKIQGMKLDAKIVMVTSRSSAVDISRVLSLGASEYIMKPFTKDILLDKIGEVTGLEVA